MQSHKHKYRFSALTSKKKNSFQRLLSSTPWNKLAIRYIAKSESVLRLPHFRFCLLYLVFGVCLSVRARRETLVYNKHPANYHYNVFYLSLTIFFLNAIIAKNMLTIINKLIGIKPKPATLLKE